MQQPVWKRNEDGRKEKCFVLKLCAATNRYGVPIGRTILVMISKANANIVGANSFSCFDTTNDITTNKRGITLFFGQTSHETTSNLYTSINILLFSIVFVPLELN